MQQSEIGFDLSVPARDQILNIKSLINITVFFVGPHFATSGDPSDSDDFRFAAEVSNGQRSQFIEH